MSSCFLVIHEGWGCRRASLLLALRRHANLSVKLNLIGASRLILVDSDWNPRYGVWLVY
jgi:hypothetical protein